MKKLLIMRIAIVAVSLVSMLSFFQYFQQSFAIDGFEQPISKLLHSPIICAFEPQPDSNFPTLGQKMLSETEYAVLDWQTKLNEGMGRHPLYNMKLMEIHLWQQKSFDNSVCDIMITYEPKPANTKLQLTEVGVTGFNIDHTKANIIIYYLGVTWDVKYSSWNAGDYHFWQYTPVSEFTGFLASDPQLQETIRHELGHSFGLGHYIVSPEELHSINFGQADPPSIMLTTEMAAGVTHYDITPADVAEVKYIYNNEGFKPNSPPPSTSTSTNAMAPISSAIPEFGSISTVVLAVTMTILIIFGFARGNQILS